MIKNKNTTVAPLAISLSNGRSGSSMVCGIIAKHGAWTGPVKSGDHRNPKGFYENSEIYRLAGRHGAANYLGVGKPNKEWHDAFINLIINQGYKGGPIIIKHSPHNWKMWVEWNPVFFTIRRSVEAQMKSRKESGHGTKGLNHVLWGEKHMDLAEERGAIRINSDDVVRGDFTELSYVIELLGLEFDPLIAADFIESDYWHFGG